MAVTDYQSRVFEAKPVRDFDNLLAVLRREPAPRPTLFEFFHNIYDELLDRPMPGADQPVEKCAYVAECFRLMGYDYATFPEDCIGLYFPRADQHEGESISLNEGAMVWERSSFEAYPWPEPAAGNYGVLDELTGRTPEGMKWIVPGPRGVLENVVAIVGYENLCLMLFDDPDLAKEIFDSVGSRLLRHYELALAHETVGAIISNDDWGYKTQTLISPDDLRRYVFPWHRRIVAAAHAAGRPAILHSCGQLDAVMDDVIDDIGFDGKHSYEDVICPVEHAYERYGGRMAVLGGIDVDFICRSEPDAVYRRCREMLERSADRGGYALGTGNSVPRYIPREGFYAMLAACIDARK